MEYTDYVIKLILIAMLWLVLAAPILALVFYIERKLRRQSRKLYSRLIIGLSIVTGALIAPVPTPIITVFLPNYVAFISGYYQKYLFADNSPFYGLWSWVLWSIAISTAVFFAASISYVVGKKNA